MPATYVFCLIAAARRVPRTGRSRGPAGLGVVRLLEIGPGEWLAVADAPLGTFGEKAINKKLSNLDWVARAAMAHESVIESFMGARAVLPMKLFTIFASDQRAGDHVRLNRRHIDEVLERVRDHHEWGIRVAFHPKPARAAAKPQKATGREASGIAYLTGKKARREEAAELSERAAATVDDLFDRLARLARLTQRRSGRDMPVPGGPLLLDAVFLVPASRSVRFRSAVTREARVLGKRGYHVTLTGPWPPYSFVQDQQS